MLPPPQSTEASVMAVNTPTNPPQSAIDALYNRYDSGDLSGTEALSRQLLKDYPGATEVLNMLGVVLNAQGQSEEAIAAYQRALQLNPAYADVYNNLGIVLYKLGRDDEAVINFQHAVLRDPDYADACNNLGVVLQSLGRHGEALSHLENAVKLQPDSALAAFNLANTLRAQARLEEALLSFNRAVKLNPGYCEAFNNCGNLYEDLQRFDEACDSYSHAIQIRPDYSLAYSNRGLVQKKLGNYKAALQDFHKTMELDARVASLTDQDLKFRIQVNMGDIFMYFRQFEMALAAYDAALEIEPERKDVIGFKGNAIAALGRLEEGLQLRQEGFGFIAFDSSAGVSIKHG